MADTLERQGDPRQAVSTPHPRPSSSPGKGCPFPGPALLCTFLHSVKVLCMPTMCQALPWGWGHPWEEAPLPTYVSRDGRYKSISKSIMLGGGGWACVWLVTPAPLLDKETAVRGGTSTTSNVPSKPSTGVQFSGIKYIHRVVNHPHHPSPQASEQAGREQEDCEASLGKKNLLILVAGSAPRLPRAAPGQLGVWLLALQKPGS